jgi:uncharacterized protein (UPF0333 family)
LQFSVPDNIFPDLKNKLMRILIILGLIASAIPGALLGMLLIKIFPHIPMLLHIVAVMLVVVGSFLLIIRNRKAYYADMPEEIPAWAREKKYPVILAITTLVASLVTFNDNKTSLYIDNGNAEKMVVRLKYEGEFEVPAHAHVKKEVVIGDDEIVYDGRTVKLPIAEDGKWIVNLNKQNKYVRTSVVYSANPSETQDDNPEFKLFDDEFFNAKVDYVFDAPEKITVKKSDMTGSLHKTVLLRL